MSRQKAFNEIKTKRYRSEDLEESLDEYDIQKRPALDPYYKTQHQEFVNDHPHIDRYIL